RVPAMPTRPRATETTASPRSDQLSHAKRNGEVSAIADELQDSHDTLDAFTGGDVGTDIRAVFSWSYQALSQSAQRLYRLLSLYPGTDGFSAHAAAALAGISLRETRLLLSELTEAHLLIQHHPARYTLHDLVRVHADECAQTETSQDDRDQALYRLLSWYLHTADATCPFLTPGRRRVPLEPLPPDCHPLQFTTYEQALDWCEMERASLVCAVHRAAESGHPGIAWRLPAALWGFFYLRSYLHDWLDTTQRGLTAARSIHDRHGEVRMLAERATVLRQLDRCDEAIADYRQAAVLYRELGDTLGRSQAVGNLGDACLHSGRLDKAVEYFRRALAIDRHLGETWGIGITLANLGDTYQRLGRFGEATECLEEALGILRVSDNRWVEGVALDILGTVAHRLDRLEEATERYHRALVVHRDIGNRWGEGHTLAHLGDVYVDTGDREAARSSWCRALAIFEEFDHKDAKEIREKLHRLEAAPCPHTVPDVPPPGSR
uniref:tetratricopeptide repeat protein n=1 Tax=Streptomyces sp. NRRL S-813 TaxID=1463919 RepID=UPI00131B7DB8